MAVEVREVRSFGHLDRPGAVMGIRTTCDVHGLRTFPPHSDEIAAFIDAHRLCDPQHGPGPERLVRGHLNEWLNR